MYKRKHYMARKVNAAGAVALKNSFKNAVLGGALIVMLLFAGTRIIGYAAKNLKIPEMPQITSPFAQPKYLVMTSAGLSVMNSTGSLDSAEDATQRHDLPVLTGISDGVKSAAHKKILKSVLRLSSSGLGGISEINIKNPEMIIMITMDGKKVIAGKDLDNEKLSNLALVIKKAGEMNKKYSVIDMRYKDRVIIR
ncbi:MAG: cell division protein FtsQ [Candidatus Goldbacteria bacterium]|nr:cell division protein FtsQ [Candidatus Goldiibacteriota bacterium]